MGIAARRRRRLAGRLVLAVLLSAVSITSGAADDAQWADVRSGGHVLMLRHALAPGTGDPEGFTLGDCASQRNLSDDGRAQAGAIGDWLRAHGVEDARVYSSQWCRCLETARGLGLGEVTELPALNSFYQRPDERAERLEGLRDFLTEHGVRDGLTILVTHQVTIAAATGRGLGSGQAVILRMDEDSLYDVVGTLRF